MSMLMDMFVYPRYGGDPYLLCVLDGPGSPEEQAKTIWDSMNHGIPGASVKYVLRGHLPGAVRKKVNRGIRK